MDPRLVQFYHLELEYLREMGKEFAELFPKVAARLAMNATDVPDPYVERIIESVAFLAARVQLKVDAEFPRFTQALLESVFPHYLSPTPSMVVAQCTPALGDPSLASGFRLPRGTAFHGGKNLSDQNACEFRTAHDVQLWPIKVVSASYFTHAPDLPLAGLPIAQRIKGGIRLRLQTTAELTFAQTPIEHLPIYLGGRPDVANTLYELCLATSSGRDPQGCLGVLLLPVSGNPEWKTFLPGASLQPAGFSDDEAMLPVTPRSFQGYRLLQEYFSFPQRFRFLDLRSLREALARFDTNDLDVVILLGRGAPNLESVVDDSNFSLFCTPAINLFEKKADRIPVKDGDYEFHVVPNRARPLDFEVYDVKHVIGYGAGPEREFRPFYAAYDADGGHGHAAYFTTRREPRLVSADARRRGARSSYIGTEVFLSLVDADSAPFDDDLKQLSVQTLCTNRDLVLHMPVGLGKTDLRLDVTAPVATIRIVAGPSRPYAPLADGSVAWKAISHLSLNYLSLLDVNPDKGAAALRDALDLYAASGDVSAKRQIEAIRSVVATPTVARLPPPRPRLPTDPRPGSTLAFGRGLDIAVEVDELAFEGASAFMLGAVLQHYFARAVSINSFTRTSVQSQSRGVINQWMPQWGARPTL